jgi:hypothetical protein
MRSRNQAFAELSTPAAEIPPRQAVERNAGVPIAMVNFLRRAQSRRLTCSGRSRSYKHVELGTDAYPE